MGFIRTLAVPPFFGARNALDVLSAVVLPAPAVQSHARLAYPEPLDYEEPLECQTVDGAILGVGTCSIRC